MTWLEKMIASAVALGPCDLGTLVPRAVAGRQPAGLPDHDRIALEWGKPRSIRVALGPGLRANGLTSSGT